MTLGPSRGHEIHSLGFSTCDQRKHNISQQKPEEENLEAVDCHVFFHMENVTLEEREEWSQDTERSRDVRRGERERGRDEDMLGFISLISPFLRPRHVPLLEFLETSSILLTNSPFLLKLATEGILVNSLRRASTCEPLL